MAGNEYRMFLLRLEDMRFREVSCPSLKDLNSFGWPSYDPILEWNTDRVIAAEKEEMKLFSLEQEQ